MKVYSKVPTANGIYASVNFQNGVGETDNPHLLDWFKKHGYTLESDLVPYDEVFEETPVTEDTKPEKTEEVPMMGVGDEPDEIDFDKMTANEIREWALANGFGGVIRNTRNKEKLIEKLRGE